MEGSQQEKLNPDQDSYSETKLTEEFSTQAKICNDLQVHHKEEENDKYAENHDEEEEEEEEEEFSFVLGGESTSPVAADDAFVNGQIKPVFPLFNRDLFFSGDEQGLLHENLPMKPPVKKVFVETIDSPGMTSSVPGDDEIAGPYCEWSSRKAVEACPEVCKKSNSTGFSKLWRFKEFMGRSNSDGRDTFIFLNNGHAQPPSAADPPVAGREVIVSEKKVEEKGERKLSTAKVNGKVKKKGSKSKTASLSAHEVYLRSKAKDDEKRRSYLPYRPELMGFFTNVNGGLSKNVHPF